MWAFETDSIIPTWLASLKATLYRMCMSPRIFHYGDQQDMNSWFFLRWRHTFPLSSAKQPWSISRSHHISLARYCNCRYDAPIPSRIHLYFYLSRRAAPAPHMSSDIPKTAKTLERSWNWNFRTTYPKLDLAMQSFQFTLLNKLSWRCFATFRTRLPLHRHCTPASFLRLGPGRPNSSRLFTEDVPRRQGTTVSTSDLTCRWRACYFCARWLTKQTYTGLQT